MNAIEICLILVGVVCIVVSLIFETASDTKADSGEVELSKEQVETINQKITGLIDEQLSDLDEKTEITIEKISNKKIMEFTEYTDTVLAQVNRNHEETMFLYDMLNEKTKVVKRTISEYEAAKADEAVRESKEMAVQSGEEASASKVPVKKSKSTTNKKESDGTKTDGDAKPVKRTRRNTKSKVSLTSNNNEKILELHKEGRNNIEIAKILGLGIGEVKLVIDLFTGDEE